MDEISKLNHCAHTQEKNKSIESYKRNVPGFLYFSIGFRGNVRHTALG